MIHAANVPRSAFGVARRITASQALDRAQSDENRIAVAQIGSAVRSGNTFEGAEPAAHSSTLTDGNRVTVQGDRLSREKRTDRHVDRLAAYRSTRGDVKPLPAYRCSRREPPMRRRDYTDFERGRPRPVMKLQSHGSRRRSRVGSEGPLGRRSREANHDQTRVSSRSAIGSRLRIEA